VHPYQAAMGERTFQLSESQTTASRELHDRITTFLKMVGIPLSFSITDGLSLGFMSYPIIKLLVGKGREAG
jgi:xanthine/uracil/vitamin C permease (AzgA family)